MKRIYIFVRKDLPSKQLIVVQVAHIAMKHANDHQPFVNYGSWSSNIIILEMDNLEELKKTRKYIEHKCKLQVTSYYEPDLPEKERFTAFVVEVEPSQKWFFQKYKLLNLDSNKTLDTKKSWWYHLWNGKSH